MKVRWEFLPAVPPDQFDSAKSLGNQARFIPIDDKRVEQYAEAMRRGDKFPPVVAHRAGKNSGYIISDGNPGRSGARKLVFPGVAPAPTDPLVHDVGAGDSALLPPSAGCSWRLWEQVAAGFLRGHRPATRASYRTDLADLTRFAVNRGRPVLMLTRVDLDDYVEHLLEERRLATSTVRRRLTVTHQVFTWAVEQGVLPDNPARWLRRPRAQTPPARLRLTPEQMKALVSAAEADSPRSAVLVHLMLLHGSRVGTVLAADVTDLHGPPQARRLRLRAKGGVQQDLPLSRATAAHIDKLVGSRQDGPLLRSSTGARWHRTCAARHLRRLGQQALDPAVARQLHPHALRRSFVDAGLAAGATLAELQFALGHRSPAMVLVYAAQLAHDRDPVAWRVAVALSSVALPRPGVVGEPRTGGAGLSPEVQEGGDAVGEVLLERHAGGALALEHLQQGGVHDAAEGRGAVGLAGQAGERLSGHPFCEAGSSWA